MTGEEKPKPGQISHGVWSFLRTGRISPSVRGFRRIRRYLKEIERELIEDLGGTQNLTAAKEILIKSTLQAFGVILLAAAYSERHSIFREDRMREGTLELQPVFSNQYLAFMNTIRQNLALLGLERQRADEILDLKKYLEIKAREKEEAEKIGKKRAHKPQDGQNQSDKASDMAGSQDPAVFDEKRGSESLLDKKSPAGQGSDIGQSGAIGKDGQGEET
jgi:hypothetical protein